MKGHIFLLGLLVAVSSMPVSAQAAPRDECAIWFCAPLGFLPRDCHAAFRAMVKRVSTFRAPVPLFGACESGHSGAQMSFKDGIAAVMVREQRTCVLPGPDSSGDDCELWKVDVPGKYIKDTFCYDPGYGTEPEGCIDTYKYVEVYRDGELIGDTYYYPQ